MDEILRARLRIPYGANKRLKALRYVLRGVDAMCRKTSGQAFFAFNEAEALLREIDGRTGAELVDALLAMNGGTKIIPYGVEHIPASGPVVIGSTHPVGTFDFIAHAGAMMSHRPDLKVVANREAERFLGSDRIIAVDLNRDDKVLSARQTLKGMESHLKDDGALLIFGSGRVADRRKGQLFEPAWRSGITRMSALCDAPIVPASAHMSNSNHYYVTRKLAQTVSFGNEYFGREVASLRYSSELIAKLGGQYDVHYGAPLPAGSKPSVVQCAAEQLIDGFYASDVTACQA